ncbi:MAG: 23S rRNA (guanosine(2251)-2'-O)-methyltransferase RlmB [Oceanospirillaceae bacterium]|nr:23S rRNA (guanosine(2251)-2'-O)-methyltransferase RlmB [Oceanospirillaceae bacterium]
MANIEYVFGIHAVQTKLQRNPERVQEIWFQEGREDRRLNQVRSLADDQGIECQIMPRRELDNKVKGRHQGVVAACTPSPAKDEHFLTQLLEELNEPAFLLILDGVTDPHNLGACLRTADAAGVHAVIAPKDKSASLNSTVSNVACGAAESMPFVQVTNLARCLKTLQASGVWITGTAGEATQDIYQADLKGSMALVMGAEGEGMRRLTREGCDQLVKIPMAGEVSSLNVSVAAGVCLFEAVRQRS